MAAHTSGSAAADVLERMLHEGFAVGNADIVDELCSPEIVEHQFGLSGDGGEAIDKIKRAIVAVHTAMPDLRFDVADVAVAGDTVWMRAEATGTNTGPFIGAPTGKPVHFTVFDVATVREGRIVEHWGVPDRFALLVQTGQLEKLAAP